MGQTADQLRQELDQKRRELTHDVDRIETKVRETFDLNSQIEQNPLLAVGLAVAGGFVLGSVIGGGKSKDEGYQGSYGPTGGYSQARFYGGSPQHDYAANWSNSAASSAPSAPRYEEPQGPGMIATVASGVKESFRKGSGGSTVEDTLSNVTAALTAVLMDKAKEMLDQNLPGFADKFEQAARRGTAQPGFGPTPTSTGGYAADSGRTAGATGGTGSIGGGIGSGGTSGSTSSQGSSSGTSAGAFTPASHNPSNPGSGTNGERRA